jgi:hypothetical protein
MSANNPQHDDALQESCNLQIPPTCGACSYIGLCPDNVDYCLHPMTKYMRVQIAQAPPDECPMRRDH